MKPRARPQARGTQEFRTQRGAASGLRGAAAALTLLIASACAGCAPARDRAQTLDHSTKKISLAQLYMEAGKYVEAVSILSELARTNPKDADIQFNLGVARFGASDYPGAESALREALRLDPRKTDAHNYLGAVYYTTGSKESESGDSKGGMDRYRLALDEYRKVLSDPNFVGSEQVYLSLSDVHDAMGNGEEALKNARRAIEKNPKYYPAHFKIAVLLDRQEQTREAIEEYEIAAPNYASDTNYHYRLGIAYFRDNKPQRAREHLMMVTAAAPGTEKAHKAKEFLDLIAAGAPPRSGARSGPP